MDVLLRLSALVLLLLVLTACQSVVSQQLKEFDYQNVSYNVAKAEMPLIFDLCEARLNESVFDKKKLMNADYKEINLEKTKSNQFRNVLFSKLSTPTVTNKTGEQIEPGKIVLAFSQSQNLVQGCTIHILLGKEKINQISDDFSLMMDKRKYSEFKRIEGFGLIKLYYKNGRFFETRSYNDVLSRNIVHYKFSIGTLKRGVSPQEYLAYVREQYPNYGKKNELGEPLETSVVKSDNFSKAHAENYRHSQQSYQHTVQRANRPVSHRPPALSTHIVNSPAKKF